MKKIVSVCLASILIFSLSLNQQTFSAKAKAKPVIDSKTVITTENIKDVLNYLNIDSKNIKIDFNASQRDNVTVGEIEQTIKNVKSTSNIINSKNSVLAINKPKGSTALSGIITTYSIGDGALSGITGTKSFSVTEPLESSSINYEINATYGPYPKRWISVNSINISSSTRNVGVTNKVSYNNTTYNCSPSVITIYKNIIIDQYIGVTKYLSVKFNSIKVTGTTNVYANSYI